MNFFEIKDHAPSLLPDGEWKAVWSDEFDGDVLDREKWDFRLNFWGKSFAAYTDQGCIVKNSCVELHRIESNGCYVSPQLQTGANSFDAPKHSTTNPWGQDEIWPLAPTSAPKFVHRYGYYECRCKFQREPHVMWSAFWLQSPSIGTRIEPEWCGVESDIMEYFHVGEATSGNIMGGYGQQCTRDGRVKYELTSGEDGWHYFGMEWTPNEYVFYCDGKEMSRCNAHVSQVPQFILLTTEVHGYRRSKPYKIEGEYVDDAFIVDFVRVYDRVK